jgi:hypothetical protein
MALKFPHKIDGFCTSFGFRQKDIVGYGKGFMTFFIPMQTRCGKIGLSFFEPEELIDGIFLKATYNWIIA